MMQRAGLAIMLCMALAGCDKDPARSMKIASPPAAPAAESAAAPPAPAAPPSAAATEPAGRSKAPSSAAASGTAPVTAPAAAAVIARQTKAREAPAATLATRASPSAPKPAKDPATAKPAATAAKTPTTEAVPPASVAAADEARDAVQPGAKDWRPAGCPPPPEGTQGPSNFVVTGPCAFEHHGKFACEAFADDFYVSTTRKGANGATLMVYINVEGYKGPGEYKRAQIFVAAQDKANIYRWSNGNISITVGPNQEFVMLPQTRLPAEPLLVNCTGPMNNYQCGGRGEHEQLLASAEIAGGKLACEPGAAKKED